ncbi:MAG: hypothetical protein IPN91_12545 [Holophagaceae bacterium]|uniref:Uncharacterized protein n=1 Tax=Candidatus Geothrix odensensis TaxID=2954440 RepID=A0A936K7R1_9BACT|nr:hypothetical protein [Candidatus Geothrix odensensis]
MWVRTQTAELVNLMFIRTLRIEEGVVVARNCDEHYTLFKGDPEACKAALAHIVDGLTTHTPFVDMKIMRP